LLGRWRQRLGHGERVNVDGICHACPSRRRPCAGPCPCLADHKKRDIVELVQLHFCPLGKFPNRRLGSWLSLLARITGAKWLHYQGRRLVARAGKLLGLVPPDFKVPYHCPRCGQAQEWLDRQHEKWKRRRKRRRHARVLRKARLKARLQKAA
jgi:hypothetical protein